eukprot:TRINITY_DN1295_c1_g3_i1.p1 TRINITY_DN1295_c1_g3~~TRINITY_DN1295_c1_g3_i1.p1  ORF type:complete len:228 (+),score=81.61 TRINITY_DN1295_c1_g3_i1:52-684(+)
MSALGQSQPTLMESLSSVIPGSPLSEPASPNPAQQASRRGWQYRELKQTTKLVSDKLSDFEAAYAELPNLKERIEAISDKIFLAEKEKADATWKMDRELAEYELGRVKEALKEHNKTVVDQMELHSLRNESQKRTHEDNERKRKFETDVTLQVTEQARFKDLEFARDYAEIEARVRAIESERKNMVDTIASLRHEIASQKKLSSDIVRAK